MKRYRAALLGYYGFGNLGDELLLKACLEILYRCGVNRESIVVLSNSPMETSRSFNVDAVNRWRLREVFRAFKESERLILAGGGIFQDRTSVKSCVWYWGIVRLASMLGVKVFALGQSVGPLTSGISRMFASDALKLCGKVHVRDDNSLRLAQNLGCRDVIIGSDLVMTLKPDIAHTERRYMLVNLRPCPELEHYTRILLPHVDADTVGAALSPEDEEALRPLGLRRIVGVKTFRDAEELWIGASCAVGMRLHFGILSRIFRTRLAMMPYDVKVNEFARQSGIPCIAGEWVEPAMPYDVPESVNDVERVCREILAL